MFWISVPQGLIIGNYLIASGFYVNWDNLYNKEYYLDYVSERSPYNLYDIFEVFIYNEDIRIKIILNYYCLMFDEDSQDYINEYNLQITEVEFIYIVRIKITMPLIFKIPYNTSLSLFSYIKLE